MSARTRTRTFFTTTTPHFIYNCILLRQLDTHETNVALLQICGGIAGTIEFCQGNPTTTTGAFGGSEFTITPVDSGATITISKGRWEQGIKAVAATCGQAKPFTATFTGGASTGDVNVVLAQASNPTSASSSTCTN